MSLRRLQRDQVYRLYLAHPLAIADIENPTEDELNANPTNDPSGLIWNLTCALSTDGSQFDLDDPELDESLTFCQTSGNGEVLSRAATVVYEFEESKDRWDDAESLLAADGFNVATLAKSLLLWRGVEYLAIMSVGEADDEPFAAGHRVKIAKVSTDWATPVAGTGDNIRWNQSFAFRSDLAWNVSVV